MASLPVEALVTAAIAVWMAVAAVRNKPRGPLNWPMFTRTCCILIRLERETASGRTEMNPYRHLPSHAPHMTARDFDLLLTFLRARHPSERITGRGVFYGADRDLLIEVADGHVVAKGVRKQLRASGR